MVELSTSCRKRGPHILIDAAHDNTVDSNTTLLSYSTTTHLLYCYSGDLVLIEDEVGIHVPHDNTVDSTTTTLLLSQNTHIHVPHPHTRSA
jgi:hypothetical protein